MKIFDFSDPKLIQLIKEGGIGVLPTDTIYAIHASVFKKEVIENLYTIRFRDPNKPFIIIVPDISSLDIFNVDITDRQREVLNVLCQDSVSVVLPVLGSDFDYLTRGTGSLAFRVPKHEKLKELLVKTGPLVSTSVNKQGEKPAASIDDARAVFGNTLDFAVDEGVMDTVASTVVKLVGEKVEILRQGKVKIPDKLLLK